jgi:hypothetical protein
MSVDYGVWVAHSRQAFLVGAIPRSNLPEIRNSALVM